MKPHYFDDDKTAADRAFDVIVWIIFLPLTGLGAILSALAIPLLLLASLYVVVSVISVAWHLW